MTDQHAKGTINKTTGKLEEWFGRLTGSRKTEIKGDAKQVQGSTQQVLGNVQDALAESKDETA